MSFVVDTKGVQERAKQEIPEWSLDATNNWPAEADNILAHFAGGAAMIAIAPYVGVLPESESRFAIAETLIANLHKKLREEALKAVGPQTNDEKLEGAKDIIGRLGSGYLKEHPVYRVLLKYVKNRDLSQEQIAEVQKAALGYMVQYALDHQPLIEFVSKRFLDIVQDAQTISGITPQDVLGAFRLANDLVASGNLLQLEVLNKLESGASGVTLGRYNRRELLADMNGLRLDTTDDGVSTRGLNWAAPTGRKDVL